MTDCIIVFCTCPDQQSAQKIADALVNQSCAACVNLLPGIVSTYRWQGKLCHDQETLLLIKTQQKLFASVESTIKALHPYELPEIVAVSMLQGSQAYIDWIKQYTSSH